MAGLNRQPDQGNLDSVKSVKRTGPVKPAGPPADLSEGKGKPWDS
jgi:hypothetical protein